MEERKSIKKTHVRNDIILVVALLLLSTLGMVYLFVFRSGGNVVQVTIDGEYYGSYSLSKDMEKDIISGEDEQGINRLIIREGKAYVESATCPDGICVGHRPIFRDGESIVCLPNRVVITVITAESGTDSYDVDVVA